MKVAIYAGMYTKDQDGASKTLYELTDTLLSKKVEVGIWGLAITPQIKRGLTLYKVPSIILPLYRDYRIALPSWSLEGQIKDFNPDIIHIAAPDMAGLRLLHLAKKLSIPVLSSFHTDFASYLKSYHLGLLFNPVWLFIKWFYNQTKVVLVPTKVMAQKLKSNGVKNVRLWSRGIHLDKYNPSHRSQSLRRKWAAINKKVILFCGRFVWYKGLKTFINVYQQFKRSGKNNVAFVLAGDGPILQDLKRQMPDAFFPGYLTGVELSKVYASSDILLFPSTTEAFGNVVLEALASGLPAVVSDAGGCREIVENAEAGYVVEASDFCGFYDACKILIDNPDIHQKLRSNGIRYGANHNWEKINIRVIEEYLSIRNHGDHLELAQSHFFSVE